MTTATARSHLLQGCQPSPVLSYLKGLGILRLVSEQAEPDAAGGWSAHGFRLECRLTIEEVHGFLLDRYVPTPIVAPWNGRSGFFVESYSRDSEKLLLRLASSDDPRLADLRSAIAVGQQLHREGRARGWIQPDDKGKLRIVAKDACIAYCRNRFPDSAVPWLDAVAALAADGPAFSILLGGSGGNLGSLDLSNNWYQHLAALLLDDKPPRASELLWDALRGSATVPAVAAKIGQLDPGRAGGVGRQRDDDSGAHASWVNPWDLVLGLEGSLLFASAIARRTGREGSAGRSAMPFTVAASPTGAQGGAEGESVRGEVWFPLWHQPARLHELARLFGEARVQWDGRQAATTTDFASAVVTLGADRGLDAYERVAVAERLGQSSLAAPVARIGVAERTEVRATVLFDRWLRGIERLDRPPAAVSVLTAVRRARAAQYRLAARGGHALLTDFLTAVADVEVTVSRAGTSRGRILPVLGPRAEAVLTNVLDETMETAVALGLASLRDPVQPTSEDPVLRAHSLRACLRPVRLVGGRWEWMRGASRPTETARASDADLPLAPARVTGLGVRPLPDVLADVLLFRSRKTPAGVEPEVDIELRGVTPWFDYGWAVPAVAAEALAGGALDTDRIDHLLRGFLLLDWEYARQPREGMGGAVSSAPVPAYSLLSSFFSPRVLTLRKQTLRLRPEAPWASLLAADRAGEVVRQAIHRLRVAGLSPAVGFIPHGSARRSGQAADGALRQPPLAARVRGPDLAAAALLHLRIADYLDHLSATTRPSRGQDND